MGGNFVRVGLSIEGAGSRTLGKEQENMKSVATAVTMAFLLGAGSVAFAQAQAGGAAKAGGGAAAGGEENVQYKAKTVYDFEDDMVEGDLQRPDGELVDSLRKVKHSSLIEIRRDFIPEMLKSLEDI
jgi:hypothetical protein